MLSIRHNLRRKSDLKNWTLFFLNYLCMPPKKKKKTVLLNWEQISCFSFVLTLAQWFTCELSFRRSCCICASVHSVEPYSFIHHKNTGFFPLNFSKWMEMIPPTFSSHFMHVEYPCTYSALWILICFEMFIMNIISKRIFFAFTFSYLNDILYSNIFQICSGSTRLICVYERVFRWTRHHVCVCVQSAEQNTMPIRRNGTKAF